MPAVERHSHHLAELDRLQAEVAALSAERQRLVETVLLAERDRQLFGYELHDGIVQDLTAAVMLLENAMQPAGFATPADPSSYERGIKLVRNAIVEVRRLVGGLAAIELADLSLGVSLAQLVERYRTQIGLNVEFHGEPRHLGFAPSVRYLMLRIAQEALNNAWKHAPASRVSVRLEAVDDLAEMMIEDNGPGFDVSQPRPGHFGLEGMRARAKLLGAQLAIESRAGRGTRIRVRLPRPL